MVALLTFSNTFKIVPYLWFSVQRPEALWQALPLLPAIPLGVWIGKLMHDRLDARPAVLLVLSCWSPRPA